MLRFIIAFISTFSVASAALAWGQTGHRVTGEIAQSYLSDEARAQIVKILGTESLAEASTWADFMRSSTEPYWKNTAGPFHYVTVPVGKTYEQVGAPEEGDAKTALAGFAKTLKDPKASAEEKALALRFTIHIIGDLHQPLHAGNGTDRGGNRFNVVFFNQVSNLHSVWDSGMIDREGLSFLEKSGWLKSKITAQQASLWAEVDPLVWIAESTAIRDTIYPQNPFISWDYPFAHMATVNTRLSQAGIRLATYLNALYEAPATK